MMRAALVLVGALSLATACEEEKRDASQWPLSREELVRHAPSDDGAALNYRRYCIGCHGNDGRGNGGATGADLTAVDSPLASRSDAELAASIRDGKRGKTGTMPPHQPVLTDSQIAALVAYVRERFQPRPSAGDAGP